ncbi:iron-containing alcohol dehydrogenase [Paenisporosarcina sp. TG20]|uniref:iron-containing alcohol dehydrogenase n=1 Tax=Paenisporosarcina sp. TG20 TaxID=1211706 RepID=UPI0003106472|nr:iron-containing alcohol dehydrogenase [Paenisporosarcina sp. TG20]
MEQSRASDGYIFVSIPGSQIIIQDGAKVLNDFEPDWIIGIGGGSVMDWAKAMWLFHEHPELTFEEAAKPFTLPKLRTKAKFAAIPTTSGSGVEVSN